MSLKHIERLGWAAKAVTVLSLVAVACPLPLARGDSSEDAFRAIPWQEGPTIGDMGLHAQIKVPEGFLFTGPGGTQQFLELTENPPNPKTVGVLLPTGESEGWVVYFDYADSGHVKDDDRNAIDAASLLAQFKANNEAANEERRRRGWEGLTVVDWVVRPGYEPATNRLAWGLRLRTDGGSMLANYDVRLLGRTGVMSATLACPPDQVPSLIPRLQEVLGGFEFKEGHRYAEWRSGDKVAAYGLTGLIAGGAAVAAAKAGWFAKLAAMFAKAGKAIVIGIIALLGGLWRFVSGKKAAEPHA
jgi:uncharacterized membrane-anchored protein